MHHKHLILMVLCCALPVVALAAVFLFQLQLSGVVLFAIILLCPLSYLLMMGGLGHGKQDDAHHTQESGHG